MDANLYLAAAFLHAWLDGAPAAEGIPPDGATVVVMPSSDPEPALTNLDPAARAAETNKLMYPGTPGGEAIHDKPIKPVWPKRPERLRLVLDYQRDVDV